MKTFLAAVGLLLLHGCFPVAAGNMSVVNNSGCTYQVYVHNFNPACGGDWVPYNCTTHTLAAGATAANIMFNGSLTCPSLGVGWVEFTACAGCGGADFNVSPTTTTVATYVTLSPGGGFTSTTTPPSQNYAMPTPLNTGSSDMWYQLTDNGVPTGIVALVHPGQTGQFLWVAPLGNTDVWGVQSVPVVGSVSVAGGTTGTPTTWGRLDNGVTFNADGSGVEGPIIVGTPTAFTTTPPAITGSTSPNVMNADGSWNGLDPSTGLATPGLTGTNLNVSPDGTNGYVKILSTTNTGSLDKGTYIGGVDAIVKADSLDTAGIINAINQADADVKQFKSANHTDLTSVNGNLVSVFGMDSNIWQSVKGLTNDTRLHGDLTNLTAVDEGVLTNIEAIVAILTNGPPTNGFDGVSATNFAFAQANGSFADLAAMESALTPAASGLGSGGGSMLVSWGGFTLNLNPMDLPGMADVAAWVRAAFTFLTALFCFRDAWTAIEGYLKASGAVRQATTAGESVLGNNVNAVSAQAMAIAITAVIAVLPGLFVTWLGTTHYVTTISAGLVASPGGPVGSGLSLVNSFLPVDYIVTGYVGVLIFRMQVGGAWWAISTVVRHLTGA